MFEHFADRPTKLNRTKYIYDIYYKISFFCRLIMVRNYKRKTDRGTYSRDQINAALAAVRQGTSVRRAALDFRIEPRTLNNYWKKYKPTSEVIPVAVPPEIVSTEIVPAAVVPPALESSLEVSQLEPPSPEVDLQRPEVSSHEEPQPQVPHLEVLPTTPPLVIPWVGYTKQRSVSIGLYNF